MDRLLTREDTKVIKGIAILLMLLHHLWGFTDRLPGGYLLSLFQIFGYDASFYIAGFGKICVSFFFFVGGYGVYVSSYGRKYDLIGKLKGLYISYWKVFVIFVPIAFIFFSNQPQYCDIPEVYARYAEFNAYDVFADFLGLSNTVNGEWWFLFSYVVALISFPLVRGIVQKNSARVNIFLVMLGSILITNFLPNLVNVSLLEGIDKNFLFIRMICQRAPFVASFWMGIVVAHHGLLDRLQEGLIKHKLLNPFIDIFIWVCIILIRPTPSGAGEVLDIFYVPFLIVTAMDLLKRIPILMKGFSALGKESTNMWLTHTFLCYYFYLPARIVVHFRWALPCLIILLVMSYITARLITYFWKLVAKIFDKITASKKIVSQ